ncbi:MAG: hypothetical protein KatS3mg129_1239 [Leptospiraceae bacterium]|nr:MAG: hypothetical protein KatS3mg129_1239 [Leptospiraceae bacterium]
MKTLNIEYEYLEKIRELYYKYKDKSIDLENGLIIVRELIYNPDILILGLNPSRNKKHDDDVKRQNNIAFWYPYVIPDIKGITFTSLEDYHYIKERNIYVNPYIYEKYYKNFIRKTLLHSWEYFDLFWIRKTNASELFSDNNIDFLKEQSKLSIEIITEIKPKIIIGCL